jgi:DNA-binding NtrC family response regulator
MTHPALEARHLRVVKGSATDGRQAPFGCADDALSRLADTGVAVLIRGEKGTGKEVAAREIHARSRNRRAFIKVTCSAPAQVLEAELFGCERGAGGAQHRPGKLEFANGGTLFLDEILDLPSALQLRLLQVLEHGGFSRLGARDRVRVRVRVLAASAGDIERAVAEKRFLETLFFRLNVVSLTLPPLRQRRDEIADLARFFLRQFAAHYNRPEVVPGRQTLRLLHTYDWPGNVHELRQRMRGLATGGSEADLQRDLRVASSARGARPGHRTEAADASPALPGGLKEIGRQAADAAERALIYRTLQLTRWNRREAATILRVSYKALLYKIKKAELAGAR